MGIFLFQCAIAIIMVVTRLVAPNALVWVALAITGFTLFMVNWMPLMALQLAVTWGLFALLSNWKQTEKSE